MIACRPFMMVCAVETVPFEYDSRCGENTMHRMFHSAFRTFFRSFMAHDRLFKCEGFMTGITLILIIWHITLLNQNSQILRHFGELGIADLHVRNSKHIPFKGKHLFQILKGKSDFLPSQIGYIRASQQF